VRLFCVPSAALGGNCLPLLPPSYATGLYPFHLYVCGCLCQIEGLKQDRGRLVSEKDDLVTRVTKLEMERDDLISQLDAEKVSTASVLLVTAFVICSARLLLLHMCKFFSTVHKIVAHPGSPGQRVIKCVLLLLLLLLFW